MNAAPLWVGLLAAIAAFGQAAATANAPGWISGVVVGDDGTPIPNARVYAGLPAASSKMTAPPVLLSKVVNSVPADKNGAFTIFALPAGSYVLGAETALAGWLDPCHWSASVPLVSLAAGQVLKGERVVLAKGSVLTVTINDPAKLLPLLPSPIAHDVEVMVKSSGGYYFQAKIATTSTVSRTHSITLPFNATHTLVVRSQKFHMNDTTGAAVPAAGHVQSVQTPPAASAVSSATPVGLTVVGKVQ